MSVRLIKDPVTTISCSSLAPDTDEAGAWQRVVNGTRITLLSDKNAMTTFVIVDANTLRLVDAQGKEFKTQLNYDLKRDKTYSPVDAPAP